MIGDNAENGFIANNFCFTNGEIYIEEGTLANLIYGEKITKEQLETIPSNVIPSRLFAYSSGLKSVHKGFLPATTLSMNCYYGMFYGCYALTAAPELPAKNLASSCYARMFYDCILLTTAPELPATTLANSCYSAMFTSCYSLEKAPELPGVQHREYNFESGEYESVEGLANGCYESMFAFCISLEKAPALPSTILANRCYNDMFEDCISLEKAPELPGVQHREYNFESGEYESVEGLANGCYMNMFNGCAALTQAPQLPAETLAASCYNRMFARCSSLCISEGATDSPTKFFTCPTDIPNEAVTFMFSETGGSFTTGTPTAGKTYYYGK